LKQSAGPCPPGWRAVGRAAILVGMAGYSATPLTRKLGIKSGQVIAMLDAPSGFADLLAPLPEEVETRKALDGGGPFDVVICFITQRAALERRVAEVRPVLTAAGGLWIAWPKKSSGVPTEVGEDAVREVALPTGLVDNKVCAIDETWSGLRLVIRRELR
jgi:hypothetical protein